MIPNEKIQVVQEYLNQGFADRFVAQRAGVSRATVALVRDGKIKPDRKEFKKAHERSLHTFTDRDYERIIQDAKLALVQSGREKYSDTD